MDENTEQSLTLAYALTRNEIFHSFLRSLAASPKFRYTIILYSVLAGAASVLPSAIESRSLTLWGAITAAGWIVGFLAVLSLAIYVLGKTATRTLTISCKGIYTEIGRHRGQIPWSKIGTVTETPQFVLIAGRNGNAFFIPDRAFLESAHRQQFVATIRGWMSVRK